MVEACQQLVDSGPDFIAPAPLWSKLVESVESGPNLADSGSIPRQFRPIPGPILGELGQPLENSVEICIAEQNWSMRLQIPEKLGLLE